MTVEFEELENESLIDPDCENAVKQNGNIDKTQKTFIERHNDDADEKNRALNVLDNSNAIMAEPDN